MLGHFEDFMCPSVRFRQIVFGGATATSPHIVAHHNDLSPTFPPGSTAPHRVGRDCTSY